jgi:DNA-binding CsgD family transcriptional regulator
MHDDHPFARPGIPNMTALDADTTASLWREVRAGGWSVVQEIERDGRRFIVARKADASLDVLTTREREALKLAVAGHSNKRIAIALGIAPSTIAGHLGNAMRKLGAQTRVELVRLYRLLDAEEP